MDISQIKKQVGLEAVKLIQNNMIVGLGTGSTANFFIEALGKRCAEGLVIKAVATSKGSEKLAKKLNIPLTDINELDYIDITIDGADQVDFNKNLIKGMGGALLREKIVASFSKQIIIIIDEKKYLKFLGNCSLPVEITPFGFESTKKRLEKLGYRGSFRKNKQGLIYLTDNKNYILDLEFNEKILDPKTEHIRIKNVAGVVETGFFFDLPIKVLIGSGSNQIEFK